MTYIILPFNTELILYLHGIILHLKAITQQFLLNILVLFQVPFGYLFQKQNLLICFNKDLFAIMECKYLQVAIT